MRFSSTNDQEVPHPDSPDTREQGDGFRWLVINEARQEVYAATWVDTVLYGDATRVTLNAPYYVGSRDVVVYLKVHGGDVRKREFRGKAAVDGRVTIEISGTADAPEIQ